MRIERTPVETLDEGKSLPTSGSYTQPDRRRRYKRGRDKVPVTGEGPTVTGREVRRPWGSIPGTRRYQTPEVTQRMTDGPTELIISLILVRVVSRERIYVRTGFLVIFHRRL